MVKVGRSEVYKPGSLIVGPVFTLSIFLTLLLVPLSVNEASAYGSITHAQTTVFVWDVIKDDLESSGLNLGDPQGSREEIIGYYTFRNAFIYGANAPDAAHIPSKLSNTPEAFSQLDTYFGELDERRVGGHDIDINVSEISPWPINSHSLDFAIDYLLKSAWQMPPSDERTEKICFALGYIAHILQDKHSHNLMIWLDDATALGDLGLEEPMWGGEVGPLLQLESLIDLFICVKAPTSFVVVPGANASVNEYGIVEWIRWPGEEHIIASEYYVVTFDLPEFLSIQMHNYIDDHTEILGNELTKTGLFNNYYLWTTYLDFTPILKGKLYDPMQKFLQKHFGTTKFSLKGDTSTPYHYKGYLLLEDGKFKIEVDLADWLPFGGEIGNISAELGESEVKEAVKNYIEAYRDYLDREITPDIIVPGEWYDYVYIDAVIEEGYYPNGISIGMSGAENHFSVGDYVVLEYYDPILGRWHADECCSTIGDIDPDSDSMNIYVPHEFGHYQNAYVNKIRLADSGECVPPRWNLINIGLTLPYLPDQQLQVYANFWNKSLLFSFGRCGPFLIEVDIPEIFFAEIYGLLPLIGINTVLPDFDLDPWYAYSIEYQYAKRANLTDSNGQLYADFWTLRESEGSAQGAKSFVEISLEDIISNGITGAMERNRWLDDEYWVLGSESLRRAAVMKSLLREGYDSQYINRSAFRPRWMQVYDIRYLRGTERIYEIPDASADPITVQVELFSPLWDTPPIGFNLGLRVRADDPEKSYESDEIVSENHYALNWQDLSIHNLLKHNQGKRLVFETSFTPKESNYGYHVDLTWNGKVFFTTDLEPFLHHGIEKARIGDVQGKREKMDRLYSTYVPYNDLDYPGGFLIKSLRYIKEVAYDRNAPILDGTYAVESAGFYDGAYTKFTVGGSPFSGPDYSVPGVHIVAEKPSGLIEHIVFYTHGNPSVNDDLYGYLSGLDEKTIVLVGISDQATENIPEKVFDLGDLASLLDSKELTEVGFRDSWAYIGEKQSEEYSRWAEMRVRQREGIAVVGVLKASGIKIEPMEMVRECWWIVLITLVVFLAASCFYVRRRWSRISR